MAKRKCNFSKLSARLDPNFDPRALNAKNSDTNVNNIELDPLTMNFDELVSLLHPGFISDYLQKVLHFLKGNKNDMRFVNLAQYKVAFLVKITEDNELLKCGKFNEISRVVAWQVYEEVARRKNLFTWSYNLTNHNHVTVLLYEKIYHNQTANASQISSNNTLPAPTPMEVDEPQLDRPVMPTTFKTQILNTTLKFIKNNNAFTLHYPEMPLEHAEYVFSLLKAKNQTEEASIGFGFKSIYSSLHETLKQYEQDYDFNIKFLETGNIDTIRLLYQKSPKVNSTTDIPVSKTNNCKPTPTLRMPKQITKPQVPSNVIPKVPSLAKPQVPSQTKSQVPSQAKFQVPSQTKPQVPSQDKSQAPSQAKPQVPSQAKSQAPSQAKPQVPSQAKSQALSQAKPQVPSQAKSQAPSQAKPQVPSQAKPQVPNQAKSQVPNQAKSKASSQVKPFDESSLLDKLSEDFKWHSLDAIAEFLSNGEDDLEFKDLDYREIRYLEIICTCLVSADYERLFPARFGPLLARVGAHRRHNTCRLAVDVGPLDPDTRRRCLTVHKVPIRQTKKDNPNSRLVTMTAAGMTNGSQCDLRNLIEQKRLVRASSTSKLNTDAPAKTVSAKKRCVSKDRTKPVSKAIDFQTAGSADNEGPRPAGGLRLNNRQARLIEALSTPLESDKAERMMRMMGWSGGGLGARGEGITEPLMPAIHLAPGAGLAYEKPQPRSRPSFRIELLEALLSLLHDDVTHTTVTYRAPVSRKEARLASRVVRGTSVQLSSPQEKQLWKRIEQELSCHPDMEILAELSEDKLQLTLTKQIFTPKTKPKNKKKRPQTTEPPQTIQLDPSPERIVIDNTNIEALTLEQERISERAAVYTAYRISMMETVIEFLKLDDIQKEYISDAVLTTKQKGFIERLVYNVNRRQKVSYNTLIENDMFKQIRGLAKDCCMSVTMNGRKFTLQKKFYQKRFTNSALPPPISTDISKTVFYVHNGDNNNDNLNDNDSDIVIVEGPAPELIDISDSDDSPRLASMVVDSDASPRLDCIVDNTKSPERIKETNDLKNPTESADSKQNIADIQKTVADEENVADIQKIVADKENTADLSETADNKDIIVENIDIDLDSSEISLDVSNESLLLDMMENENRVDVKPNISIDSEFENDIKELEKAILADNKNLDITQNLNACNIKTEKTSGNTDTCTGAIQAKVEINNNLSETISVTSVKNSTNVNETCLASVKNSVTNDCSNVEFVESPGSSKRSRSDSENSDDQCRKNRKKDVYALSIEPKNDEKITLELVNKVQSLISKHIVTTNFLPLLKYSGIKNNSLIYNCHCEKSLQWLHEIVNVASDLNIKTTIVDLETECYKLNIKLHSLDSTETIFHRLEIYNRGLKTINWEVIDIVKHEACLAITVRVDEKSYEFVKRAGFCLFAGVDQARFSLVWD